MAILLCKFLIEPDDHVILPQGKTEDGMRPREGCGCMFDRDMSLLSVGRCEEARKVGQSNVTAAVEEASRNRCATFDGATTTDYWKRVARERTGAIFSDARTMSRAVSRHPFIRPARQDLRSTPLCGSAGDLLVIPARTPGTPLRTFAASRGRPYRLCT